MKMFKQKWTFFFLTIALTSFVSEARPVNYYVDASLPSIASKAINPDLSSFELFSHGRSGELLINGQWLGKEDAASFLISRITTHTTHINIYGCEFGKGQKGLDAVNYLQEKLQVSISASNNITGKDGDWVLEVGKRVELKGMKVYPENLQVTTLEFANVSGSTANGPSTANQVATFVSNTDATPTYTAFTTPTITATASFSNQQFGPSPAPGGVLEGIPSQFAMQFGGNSGIINTAITANPLFQFIGSTGTPTANMFSTSQTSIGSGINVNTTNGNKGFLVLCITDALITQQVAANVNKGVAANKVPLNSRNYFGDITITFSIPVSNPILHIGGLGGSHKYTSGGGLTYSQGYSADLELINTGYTLSKLSGNSVFNVTSNYIKSTAAIKDANSSLNLAATGSVLVTGQNIKSISFKVYMQGDGGSTTGSGSALAGAGPTWARDDDPSPGIAGETFTISASLEVPVVVSGSIFNDPDAGNVDNSTGVNSVPSGMFANLVDAAGRVVAAVPVNTDGTYSLPGIFAGNYTMLLSTTQGTQGSLAPAASLPAGWTNTGEFNGAPNTGNDGTANGISTVFAVGSTNVSDINMGIRQPPTGVTVSGNIFNDPDAGNVNNSTGSANSVPSGMYANLINGSGNVVASVPVAADGTYTIPSIVAGNYTLVLSTTQGTVSSPSPSPSLPAGWINTGEFNGAPNTGNDGTVNGISAVFAVGSTNVSDINMGIQDAKEVHPDVNITFVNVPVEGSLFTNDHIPLGSLYGAPTAISGNPDGSLPVINSNGTYSFNSPTLRGVFHFNVSVCPPGQTMNCPIERLTITVQGTVGDNPPIANTDLATTHVNTAVTLRSLSNDSKGINAPDLDPSSVTVKQDPLHGTAMVDLSTGNITYTPNPGFTGVDTLKYEVCDAGSPRECKEALQIITITASSSNITSASDDFGLSSTGNPVTGNLLNNDVDVENNSRTVTAIDTTIAGVGRVEISGNGAYTFTPTPGYSGPAHMPYKVCDNGAPQACDSATLYLLILGSSASTLPVTIHDIVAQSVSKSAVKVSWTVSNEELFSHYELERALQQSNAFSKIAHVQAAGKAAYSYIDSIKQTGKIYYRLKLVDLNGQYRYSKVVLLSGTNAISSSLKLFPNPAHSQTTLDYYAVKSGLVTINVIDMSGKIVETKRYAAALGNNLIKLEGLSKLPRGVYQVQIQQNAEQQNVKMNLQ